MPRQRADWRAEARRLAEAVPYARSQRMRRRLRAKALEGSERKRWHGAMMLAFAAGAALVLVVISSGDGSPSQPEPDEVAAGGRITQPGEAEVVPVEAGSESPGEAAIAIEGTGCDAEAGELGLPDGVVLGEGCRIVAPGYVVVGETASRLRGDGGRIDLHNGRVHVDVDPSFDREVPFVVHTPALRIEVVGTRFTVAHASTGGSLRMHEGRVRVVSSGGQTREVAAPRSLTWHAEGAGWVLSEGAADETATDETATAEPKRGAGARDGRAGARARTESRASERRADALVREVARLRARGQAAEAVRVIEEGLPGLRRRDRQPLSYELGLLLEQARGTDAACRHWAAHERQHPGGRYADLVADARARLGCDEG